MASLVPGVNLSLEMYGKKINLRAPRRVWCQLQKTSAGVSQEHIETLPGQVTSLGPALGPGLEHLCPASAARL